MSRISEQIKEARLKEGLTQKQLAKKVGVAEKYIQEVETGKKIINQDILDKIIKAVDAPINDSVIFENYTDKDFEQEKTFIPKISKTVSTKIETKNQPEIQEIWSEALSGVLADIPVFDYELNQKIDIRKLPIISNKIENYPKDKVMYIKIMDNDMSGFRIVKGDIAFCTISHQIEDNTICLLEYHNERMIRQIKKLDNNNIVLISNHGSVQTKTSPIKEINILAKILKIEFVL